MLSYKVDEENVANYIVKYVFVFQTRCPLTIVFQSLLNVMLSLLM